MGLVKQLLTGDMWKMMGDGIEHRQTYMEMHLAIKLNKDSTSIMSVLPPGIRLTNLIVHRVLKYD